MRAQKERKKRKGVFTYLCIARARTHAHSPVFVSPITLSRKEEEENEGSIGHASSFCVFQTKLMIVTIIKPVCEKR